MSADQLEQRINKDQNCTDLVSRWIQQYLLDCKARQLADGTIAFYRKKLHQLVRYCNDVHVNYIDEINANILRAFLVHLEETGHNPGGVSGHYRVVRSFLLWYEYEAEPENWRNPIKRVKGPKAVQDLIEPVTVEQVSAILQTFGHTEVGIRNTAIILMLFDTGVRANELLTLTLGDVDLVSGAVNVMGKGNKPRVVYMGQKRRKALRNYVRVRGYEPGPLFINTRHKKQGINYHGLRSMIQRASKAAGIDPPALHSFRRGYALNMLRNGADVYTLQNLMGHADLQVLRRYLRQTNEDLELVHRRANPADNSPI